MQEQAEGVEVRATVHRFPGGLLGCHVLRGPEDPSDLRQLRRVALNAHLGDSEVEDLDEVVRRATAQEQHVVRLEVAMDHVHIVSGLERSGDLTRDSKRTLRRQGAALVEDGPQALPRHILQRHEERAVLGPSEVRRHRDVRMIDASRGDGFAFEPLDGLVHGGHLRVEHLDGHGLLHRHVMRPVDGAHASRAEERVDAVPIGDHFSNPALCVGVVRRRLGLFGGGFRHRGRLSARQRGTGGAVLTPKTTAAGFCSGVVRIANFGWKRRTPRRGRLQPHRTA